MHITIIQASYDGDVMWLSKRCWCQKMFLQEYICAWPRAKTWHTNQLVFFLFGSFSGMKKQYSYIHTTVIVITKRSWISLSTSLSLCQLIVTFREFSREENFLSLLFTIHFISFFSCEWAIFHHFAKSLRVFLENWEFLGTPCIRYIHWLSFFFEVAKRKAKGRFLKFQLFMYRNLSHFWFSELWLTVPMNAKKPHWRNFCVAFILFAFHVGWHFDFYLDSCSRKHKNPRRKSAVLVTTPLSLKFDHLQSI